MGSSPTSSTVEGVTVNDTQIVIDLTSYDCWVLAKYIHELNPDRYKVALLGDEHGGWSHALAHDVIEDMYIDIEGKHTKDDVLSNWDWNTDWDLLRDVEGKSIEGMAQESDSTLEDALDLLNRSGVVLEGK